MFLEDEDCLVEDIEVLKEKRPEEKLVILEKLLQGEHGEFWQRKLSDMLYNGLLQLGHSPSPKQLKSKVVRRSNGKIIVGPVETVRVEECFKNHFTFVQDIDLDIIRSSALPLQDKRPKGLARSYDIVESSIISLLQVLSKTIPKDVSESTVDYLLNTGKTFFLTEIENLLERAHAREVLGLTESGTYFPVATSQGGIFVLFSRYTMTENGQAWKLVPLTLLAEPRRLSGGRIYIRQS